MSQSERQPVVFVSSTYLDNQQRRAWVREVIERAGMVPLAMERWTANEKPARELCVHRVGEADVFLMILAWRYGWIPDGAQKSITELEYDEAVRLGKPRLVFWIDQSLREVDVESEFDADDMWRKQVLLDAFKQRARTEQTAQPFTDAKLQLLVMQALTDWGRRSFPGWVGAEGAAAFRELKEHEARLADYLEMVAADHASVTLPGFSSRLRVPLALEDLYVPIDVALSEHPEESAREELRGKGERDEGEGAPDADPTLPAALRLVAGDVRRRGIVLLGHPGSGKTTQLRRLALTMAREGPAALGLDDELVPVFVPLRMLTPKDTSLAKLVQRLVADEERDLDPGFAKWLWKRGRLLLLIDGLDELAKERRGEVKEWIEKVARGNRQCLAVVTCRYEGYPRNLRFDERFLGYSLRPLSNEQADRFVEHWYREVETGLLPPNSDEPTFAKAAHEAQRKAEELIARLRDPSVRAGRMYELAHNPLLLTAICLVHRDRAKLPDRAAELYADAIDALLQHWREAKQLPVSFEARTARRILQPVALWLHEEEGRTQAGEDELCEVLEEAMRAARWNEMPARAFLSTVRDESGLLTGWSAERFGFLHLAFQEYLAAAELCRRALQHAGDATAFQREVAAICNRLGPSWWREVLALVFALDEDGALFAPLVSGLLRRADLPVHEEIFRQCLADAPAFDPSPFRELLRMPAEEGLWRNRSIAASALIAHGEDSFTTAELHPAIQEIEMSPGSPSEIRRNRDVSRTRHADQLQAMQLLARIAPEALRQRHELLRDHPSPEVRSLVSRLHGRAVVVETSDLHLSAHDPTVTSSRWFEERSSCELVLIPGGRFLMGSTPKEAGRYSDEGPAHEVEVSDFFLARHPVTNEQYARFLRENPGVPEPARWGDRNFNQPRQPVVGLSWDEAKAFCKWAELELPSETCWEYACRAGTSTRYWSGDAEEGLARVGWYANNSGGRLHPVGEKPANPFGLFDVHGNVWEWCEDDWSGDYSESGNAHPGPFKQQGAAERVVRGGSFFDSARDARSACRVLVVPGVRSAGLGFRPAKGIEP